MHIGKLEEIMEEGVSHDPHIMKRVMIPDGTIPNLTNFSQARFAPGAIARGHNHPSMHEIYLIESGNGQVTIEGTPYEVGPGTYVHIHPREKHSVVNTGKKDLVITYFGIEEHSVS